MRELRKKQKKLKKLLNVICTITGIFIFVYIGVQPKLVDYIGQTMTVIVGYIADILVLASICILF